MNKLPIGKRASILTALAEGCSMRSTARMNFVSINTVVKLLIEAGTACAEYQDRTMKGLTCKRLQVDEIWSFCHAKEKNVPAEHKGEWGFGDVWTFTAIDADTKLCPTWLVAWRDTQCATTFIKDLAARLSNRVQLTTDGHRMYLVAVDAGFGGNVDYAMLVKYYGEDLADNTRYSPPQCNGAKRTSIVGHPDKEHVSTSYVERANLTMRMSMRRFTRLTNAFSKKVENLEHAVALYFMFYNFIRPHQTLTEQSKGRKTTPAMAAGLTDHRWTMEDLIAMMERSQESENSN